VTQVEDTLKELDRWYNELPGATDRPKLLAKLAVLELCGWLEHRLDALVQSAGILTGLDAVWIESNVLRGNHGFTYQDHLRKMLVKLVGESGVAHLEATFEHAHPGALDQMKGALTTLWTSRGVLAHTHSAANVNRQQSLNAPSWSLNQHRVVGKVIDQFEGSLSTAFGRTIAQP
jgi:hypothetical protein